MRILVTGADGQLGKELRIIASSSMTSGEGMTGISGKTLSGTSGLAGAEWIFTDVADLDITSERAVDAFFERVRPHVVVNCAAFTDVDRAEREPEAAFRVNCEAVRHLAQASARLGASLVHISTDFVFDGWQRPQEVRSIPYTEEDTPSPLNVYGESKLAGEQAVFASGCAGAVIRTSWLYSPWGRNFVKSILGAASKNAEISVVSDQWGCPTSASSLAWAIAAMIPELAAGSVAGNAGVAEVVGFAALPRPAALYHYCDTGVTSRAAFAEEIIRRAGLDCRVVPVSSAQYPSNVIRPVYSALDTSKIARELGITPPAWRQTLKECLKQIEYGR